MHSLTITQLIHDTFLLESTVQCLMSPTASAPPRDSLGGRRAGRPTSRGRTSWSGGESTAARGGCTSTSCTASLTMSPSGSSWRSSWTSPSSGTAGTRARPSAGRWRPRSMTWSMGRRTSTAKVMRAVGMRVVRCHLMSHRTSLRPLCTTGRSNTRRFSRIGAFQTDPCHLSFFSSERAFLSIFSLFHILLR